MIGFWNNIQHNKQFEIIKSFKFLCFCALGLCTRLQEVRWRSVSGHLWAVWLLWPLQRVWQWNRTVQGMSASLIASTAFAPVMYCMVNMGTMEDALTWNPHFTIALSHWAILVFSWYTRTSIQRCGWGPHDAKACKWGSVVGLCPIHDFPYIIACDFGSVWQIVNFFKFAWPIHRTVKINNKMSHIYIKIN